MNVSDFDFDLPEGLIAQEALPDRTASRLLVLSRQTGLVQHSHVRDLASFLKPGDLLVMNNSRVLPARLLGQVMAGANRGISAECFLLKRLTPNTWESLIKPGKKIEPGDVISCQRDGRMLAATVKRKLPGGKVVLEIPGDADKLLEDIGHMPLPPYIKRPDTLEDKSRYQTVYAKPAGSVAAPTAGLHFTPGLLAGLQSAGIETAEITLHVGYGTFKPVRADVVEEHVVEPEVYEIPADAAEKINKAKAEGRRVIAVGTTTTRALENSARVSGGRVASGAATADIFMYPGYEFQVITGLMTNFHLPKSSLLMLVSALAGRERLLAAYSAAISQQYRFYSYGDAMLVV